MNNKAFPGYLSAQDLLLILAQQGKRITYLEASELALVIAPHKPRYAFLFYFYFLLIHVINKYFPLYYNKTSRH